MKRRIEEIDARLLTELNEQVEKALANDVKDETAIESDREMIDMIKRIQEMEKDIDKRILFEKRCNLPLKSDLQYIQKTLRLFVRHTFHPTPDAEQKGHFTLWIDGMTFREGNPSEYTVGVQSVFDRVYIEIDKKQAYNIFRYEWKLTDFPEGANVQTIKMKIPLDKICFARIHLYLSNDFNPKYSIQSEALKLILPQITCEVTEEEIATAVLHYIQNNNLFSEKDHRFVRCDAVRNRALLCFLIVFEFSSIFFPVYSFLTFLFVCHLAFKRNLWFGEFPDL
jgi:hypothetical protein